MREPSHKPRVKLFLVSFGKEIRVGLYDENSALIKELFSEKKSSEALPEIFESLLRDYEPVMLAYVRGPGSYMALKLAYVFLKTLSIVHDIPLKGCDAFEVTGGEPVKAMGKLYFIKENGKITLKKYEEPPTVTVRLPKRLEMIDFDTDAEPLYILPAV